MTDGIITAPAEAALTEGVKKFPAAMEAALPPSMYMPVALTGVVLPSATLTDNNDGTGLSGFGA